MIKFEKNGQGYFEFDLVELVKLTDLAFSIAIERFLSSPYVLKIEQKNTEDYYEIEIFKEFEVKRIIYSHEIKKYWVDTYSVIRMKEYLEFYESGGLYV